MKIQSYSLQGKRDSNEDQHFHLINDNNQKKKYNKINFVGVFDGHDGKLVSKYLKDYLPPFFITKFKKNIYGNRRAASKYFQRVFEQIQKNLERDHPRAVKYCGSTALCGINYKDKKSSMLWMINVGDSRAVMCNKQGLAVQLTQDHKPNCPDERRRIEQLGGSIKFDGSDWRIKDLSLSRAFGDGESKPYVTHLPQIYRYRLGVGDKFIIFACDGLWDVVSNQDSVEFVNFKLKSKYKGNIAKKLAEYAIEEGSYDNVSVVIMFR